MLLLQLHFINPVIYNRLKTIFFKTDFLSQITEGGK